MAGKMINDIPKDFELGIGSGEEPSAREHHVHRRYLCTRVIFGIVPLAGAHTGFPSDVPSAVSAWIG